MFKKLIGIYMCVTAVSSAQGMSAAAEVAAPVTATSTASAPELITRLTIMPRFRVLAQASTPEEQAFIAQQTSLSVRANSLIRQALQTGNRDRRAELLDQAIETSLEVEKNCQSNPSPKFGCEQNSFLADLYLQKCIALSDPKQMDACLGQAMMRCALSIAQNNLTGVAYHQLYMINAKKSEIAQDPQQRQTFMQNALECLSKAAEHGFTEAQYQVAAMYLYKRNQVSSSEEKSDLMEKALVLLQKAGTNSNAQNRLALLLCEKADSIG